MSHVGIATTIVGIVCGCSGSVRQTVDLEALRLLECFRRVLTNEFPRVDLDDDFNENPSSNGQSMVPTLPMQVWVEKVNVANRMTTLTTRHLLDMVTMTIDVGLVFDAAAWRRQHMFVGARLSPRNESSLFRTLRNAIAGLDCHPLMQSLHVEEFESKGILVLVSLDANADVTKHGFHPEDVITWNTSHTCNVSRRDKTLVLCLTERRNAVEGARRASRVSTSCPMATSCRTRLI